MVEIIELFNQEQEAGSTSLSVDKPIIKIEVGIATGEVIAGFTGTMHRATYTCLGDTVNLVARLEEHTNVVGQPILINGTTREALDDDILVKDQASCRSEAKKRKCTFTRRRQPTTGDKRVWLSALNGQLLQRQYPQQHGDGGQ